MKIITYSVVVPSVCLRGEGCVVLVTGSESTNFYSSATLTVIYSIIARTFSTCLYIHLGTFRWALADYNLIYNGLVSVR